MILLLARPARGAAAGFLACLLLYACGGDDTTSSSTTSSAAGTDSTDATTGGTTSTTAPPVVGTSTDCDAVGIHMQMAMWNPTLADEMLGLGCPWPYAASAGPRRGRREPLDRPALRRSPLHRALRAARHRAVRHLPGGRRARRAGQGLVFGFDVGAQPDGCREAATVTMHVMEWATRGHRDAAANLSANGALVLGRWTITVDGSDLDAAQRLAGAVMALGATPVTAG